MSEGISVATLIIALVALLVLDEGVLVGLWLIDLFRLGGPKDILLEQEIVCLIGELLLELLVKVILVAVEDKLFRVSALDLAQVTCDNWTI